MGEILSRRPNTIEMLALTEKFELAVLRSILEVRVETALIGNPYAEKSFQYFLILATCLTIVSVIMFALLVFRRRSYPHSESATHLPADQSRHEEEKSNNLQNEENFRRYANPLKGSTSSLKGAVELSCSAPDPTLQPRAGPSGLHRSQQFLASCDVEYEIDGGNEHKSKRASQLLLQKTQNTEMTRNIADLMEPKDIEKIKLNKPTASISDSNLLTVHV